MKIIYTEGPERLETQGHGDVVRGVAREIDDEYGFGLILQGMVDPADESARETYERMKRARGLKPANTEKEE